VKDDHKEQYLNQMFSHIESEHGLTVEWNPVSWFVTHV
jgi:hypothetical protein